MVHHADKDIDVSTALRFHPFEILISMGIKMAATALIEPTVLAFDIILNGTAMFNHGNIHMPMADYCHPCKQFISLFLRR